MEWIGWMMGFVLGVIALGALLIQVLSLFARYYEREAAAEPELRILARAVVDGREEEEESLTRISVSTSS